MGLLTVLHGPLLLLLLLLLAAGGDDCDEGILVRRNTVFGASAGDGLRIECPVTFCDATPPAISWYNADHGLIRPSSRINAEWRLTGHLKGTSVLVFQKVLVEDSGLYGCRSDRSASHLINVSVTGEPSNATREADTNGGTTEPGVAVLYVYSAAGIAAFVVIVVIVSVASMRRCKGKSKNGTGADHQVSAVREDPRRRRTQAASLPIMPCP